MLIHFWFLLKLMFPVLSVLLRCTCKIRTKVCKASSKSFVIAVLEAPTPEASDFYVTTSSSQALCFCYLKAVFSSVWNNDIPPVVPCISYSLLKIHSSKLVCKCAFWLKKQTVVELLISWLSYKQLLIRLKYFDLLHNSAWGYLHFGFLAK